MSSASDGLSYSIDVGGRLEPHLAQEWLLTNGLGAFASSSVVGCNTRRYHGVLVAATTPPVGRIMTVNRIGEILRFEGEELLREFSVNQFAEGFHPRGYQYLRRFDLWDTARWEYDVDGVRVVKEHQLLWMKNVAAVRYTLTPPRGKRVELGLLPFVSLRDFHNARHAGDVRFHVKDGGDGTSIVAGYPWFADWGRDTFISLPGLLLTTGRFAEAKRVLGVFASYVSMGMIPNRFDDYTNEPHYNTVDASLWFVHAAHEYLRLSGDQATFDGVLGPACKAIVEGYRDGTRFGIRMDPKDGLILQGDEQTQLTWMDAKCNGIAYTPRQGKPVEINALWYNALRLMKEDALAGRVLEHFARTFWISPFRGLCDVVDGARRDASVRPNQIFAVSLPHSALSEDQQHAVVEVVRRELLTPYGLRTLARGDSNYRGRYCGPQPTRDAAYHNGAIWPWLIGGFLDAYLKVNHRMPQAVEQAKQWLRPLLEHMENASCIGQISEIFEADEPHRPVGCPAQAWSVAEVLRLAVELGM